jgi:hypothetical protein
MVFNINHKITFVKCIIPGFSELDFILKKLPVETRKLKLCTETAAPHLDLALIWG